ncbi:MAG: PP2C family protein-serine/threonine phosphatase [Candidatus Zixiibacteriota bacterium]
MNIELIKTLIYFLPGGFLIFLAITITRDNFVSRLNRATGIMLFFAGIGPIAMVLGSMIERSSTGAVPFNETTLYNLYLIWEFFFPALLVFAWLFPVDRLRTFKHPRLRYLIYIPQLMHLLIVIFYTDINRFLNYLSAMGQSEGFASLILKPLSQVFAYLSIVVGFVRTYDTNIFGGLNLFYVLTAIYFIESGRKYITNPRLATQSRVVIWGIRAGLGLLIVAYLGTAVLPYKFTQNLETGLLMAALLIGGGIITYAIIRHQFLDVQLFFRQSFIYTVISATLVGAYIILGFQAKKMLMPIFGDSAEVVSYILIICLLLIFQPLSNWIDNFIRSMFMHTRTDYRNILERFSRQVISMFDPKQLRSTIEETLKTALLVERVYFVLYDDSVGEYAVQPSEDYARRRIINREDLMLRGINLLNSPTNFESLSNYKENSELAEILDELKIKLILPMKDTEHLLGFLALSAKVAGYRYSAEDFNLLGVLSNQMVTALTNARLYVESLEKLRLEEEVNMARQIQLDLLPSCPPQMLCAVISAQSTPSRTVGGDFYDFIPNRENHRMGIVIADASGKGMPAALLIAQIHAMIHSEVNNGNNIATMLKNMNNQVAVSTSSEKYVTLFYGELDQENGHFQFANAGHNYPILARANGEIELLDVGGPVIGAFPNMQYESSAVVLKPEDVLFFFTDGLSEAMNDHGEEYTEDRVRSFVACCRHEEPTSIMNKILDDVYKFSPHIPPQDDTTVIALKMTKDGLKINERQI